MVLFEQHDVPDRAVMTPVEALASEQAVARSLLREIGGERDLPFPVPVDGEAGGHLRARVAALGADRHDVLQTPGCDATEIARPMTSGACKARAKTGSA